MKKILLPRRERNYDDTVCLQRDSLDLYVDGELIKSAPISPTGMDKLKDMVHDELRSGTLYQIKIRNSVQWESVPTKLPDDEGYWQGLLSYDMRVLWRRTPKGDTQGGHPRGTPKGDAKSCQKTRKWHVGGWTHPIFELFHLLEF